MTSQLNGHSSKELAIWPNPVETTLRIAGPFPQDGRVLITLFDRLGRVVQEETRDSEGGLLDTFLDVKNVAAGLYYLRVSGSGMEVRFRLMKLD
ncbi:MAG: T9SS type A sorting domain-containing protein [Bacteroidetes bacterium]|nr:T9SS type A sorting domain-containing protein [Bacteroidota bacterium]